MTDIDMGVYPRPQLVRTRWMDLQGPWGFVYDDGDQGRNEHWERCTDIFCRTIIVPFPPESPASEIADRSFHPIVWYRRTFQIAPKDREQRLLLHFGAVDYQADVWVNGQHVAHHIGGQTPFTADITSALSGEEQSVVVRAEDQPRDLNQPRGKQDWEEEPHRIWYHRTTGIWQPVWLEPVHATHVTSIRWTPNLDRALLGLVVALRRSDTTPIRLRVQLSLEDQMLADNTYFVAGAHFHTEIALDGLSIMPGGEIEHILWAPEHPNLIDARLSLLTEDGVIDDVESYVGLRSVAAENGHFLLNGRPYYLRLVLEQGYWPESHLAAPSPDALRAEVEWIKRLGFNGVRIHQKVEDPRFLYWCDRLGLLVWGETANAYAFSPDAVTSLVREWIEVLARDYSHPCIVTWVPLNESWGVPNLAADPVQSQYVQTLYSLTKTLDPTRPVIGNDGWEYLVGDMIGIHDYTFDGTVIHERYGSARALETTAREVRPHYRAIMLGRGHTIEAPVILSEFGGVSYRPETNSHWHGYGTVTSSEELLAKYNELVSAILDCPTVVGFCYTQLTDTGQETNGLLTASRHAKLDPATIHAVTSRPAAAVPGDITRDIQDSRGIVPFSGPSADLSLTSTKA
jgi:beta-galactosidase/beta-glucuronidase